MNSEHLLNSFNKMAKAVTLQELTDIGYETLGLPFFIVDVSRTILAYSKEYKSEESSWDDIIVANNLSSRKAKDSRDVIANHKLSIEKEQPVILRDFDVFPFPRMLKVVVSQNREIGSISVGGYSRDFSRFDVKFVQVMSYYVKNMLEKSNRFYYGDGNPIIVYLNSLIDGLVISEKSHKAHMRQLSIEKHRCWYILAIKPSMTENEDLHIKKFISTISTWMNAVVFVRDETIICLFGQEKPVDDWSHQVPWMESFLAENNLTAGVSRIFSNLFHLRRHWQQAVTALSIGAALKHDMRFFLYEDLAYCELFSTSAMDLENMICGKVWMLYQHDLENNNDLCRTLQAYLESARSLSKAAETLFVHRNTIRYRINKCTQILNSDLSNRDEFFSVLFSLRVVEYKKTLGDGMLPPPVPQDL